MHVQHPLCPAPLVQVVDVLCHDQQPAGPRRIQPRQSVMRGVWRLGLNGLAAHVVEAQHQIGVGGKGLWRGDILDPVIFPQATPPIVAPPEGVDTAFGADAGAGEDDDIADFAHVAHEARRQ